MGVFCCSGGNATVRKAQHFAHRESERVRQVATVHQHTHDDAARTYRSCGPLNSMGHHSPRQRPETRDQGEGVGRTPRHLRHVTPSLRHRHATSPPDQKTPSPPGSWIHRSHPPPPQGGTPCANLISHSRTFVNFLTLSRPSSASVASFLLQKGCELCKTCTKSQIPSKRSEKISRFVDFPQVRETFLCILWSSVGRFSPRVGFIASPHALLLEAKGGRSQDF